MMTTSNEHNNATAVPQGWKLVPIEPTRAMWSAVNKLDDEMAAGSDGGKGCSIEQAWNCMLDFAPDAPAPAPAVAQGEPVYQLAKLGGPTETAWIDVTQEVYEDAGFYKDDFKRRILYATTAPAPEQEQVVCGLCQGSGVLSPTQKCICQYGGKEPAQEVGLTDEQADAVSMALRRAWQLGQTYWQQADSDYISQHKKSEETQRKFEKLCDDTISALRAKGGK